MSRKNSKDIKTAGAYIVLQMLLLIYSLCGTCSKLAGQSEIFSLPFFFFYGLIFLNMGIYAVLWQQILKRVPLVTAYANRAVTVIWGLIWGLLIFDERITIQKIVGAAIIVTGIMIVVKSDGR